MKMTAEREEVIDFIAPYYDQTGILIGLYDMRLTIYFSLGMISIWFPLYGKEPTTLMKAHWSVVTRLNYN